MTRLIFTISLFLFSAFSYSQAIVSGEYFLNTDPGVGNATSFSFAQADSIDINIPIPTDGLSAGFHTLNIRFKDVNNKWTLSEGRVFYITSLSNVQQGEIISCEYFIDTDPGLGQRNSINYFTW